MGGGERIRPARGRRARVGVLTPPLGPASPPTPQSSLSLTPCGPHAGHPHSDCRPLGSWPPFPLGPCPLPPPPPYSPPPQPPVRAASWHGLVLSAEIQPKDCEGLRPGPRGGGRGGQLTVGGPGDRGTLPSQPPSKSCPSPLAVGKGHRGAGEAKGAGSCRLGCWGGTAKRQMT